MVNPELPTAGAADRQASRETASGPFVSPGGLSRFESLGGLSRWTSLGTLAHLPSLPPLSDLYALLEGGAQQLNPLSSPPPAVPLSEGPVRR